MVCKRRVEALFNAVTLAQIANVQSELGEDDDRLAVSERVLHEWIERQHHFPKNCDRNLIRNFLRGTKHNLERAKERLESHFVAKGDFVDIYSNRNPLSEDIRRAVDNVNIIFLPTLTPNGERVSIYSLRTADVAAFDMDATAKVFLMIYDLLLTAELPTSGDIAIFDATNFTSAHFVKFFTPALKRLVSLLRRNYAFRLKQIHVLRPPAVAERCLALVRPLLHEKVRRRIQVHRGLQSLHRAVPPHLLPQEYGGAERAAAELMEDWCQLLADHKDWFKEQEGVQVAGRVGVAAAPTALQGTFRKLEFD